ncbi:MAG: Ppx/GppA phosphatase family protein [Bacillota bacterium]|nr:Ppx/GppA phosphatase family protein [Bacillota bacterium]
MRKAAIDIGTNSCRLLIAEVISDEIHVLHRALKTTRIGEGISQSGKLNAVAMERTIDCMVDFDHTMQQYGVQQYQAVATSAVREADNRDSFITMMEDRTHLKVHIIEGEEEARLSYLGVTGSLELERDPLVVDIGGGSTEFIAQKGKFVLSLPLGAVKGTEQGWGREEIRDRLTPIAQRKEFFSSFPVVGVGGTATTLVAVKLGLEIYDPQKVHGSRLHKTEIEDLYHLLDKTPLSIRKRLPGLQPERADIIPSGALILLTIMEVLEKEEMFVSENDLMQALLLEPAISV